MPLGFDNTWGLRYIKVRKQPPTFKSDLCMYVPPETIYTQCITDFATISEVTLIGWWGMVDWNPISYSSAVILLGKLGSTCPFQSVLRSGRINMVSRKVCTVYWEGDTSQNLLSSKQHILCISGIASSCLTRFFLNDEDMAFLDDLVSFQKYGIYLQLSILRSTHFKGNGRPCWDICLRGWKVSVIVLRCVMWYRSRRKLFTTHSLYLFRYLAMVM